MLLEVFQAEGCIFCLRGYKCCSDVVRAAHKVLGGWGQEEIRSQAWEQSPELHFLSPWSQLLEA